MVLLVNEEAKECYVLHKYLSPYFEIFCICYKYFDMELLKKNTPNVIVFNFKRYDEVKLQVLIGILDNYPTIPIICLSDKEINRFTEIKNVIKLPKSNYKILIKKLKEIILKEPNWVEKIQEVKNYIINNITNIHTPHQISKEFNINHRELSSEFKLQTGKSIESFIIDIRFNLIKDILSKTEELGNYYSIARNCGLKDDRTLYILIKKKTGKTTKEFHEELLRSRNE